MIFTKRKDTKTGEKEEKRTYSLNFILCPKNNPHGLPLVTQSHLKILPGHSPKGLMMVSKKQPTVVNIFLLGLCLYVE